RADVLQRATFEQVEGRSALALLGGDPPAAAVGAGLEHDALGLRLQEFRADGASAVFTREVVDLELVGVGLVFLGDQQLVVGGIAPERFDDAQRAVGGGVA